MPRDGSATRARILDTAERLMIEQGYNATSLDQVIADSASSKGAFFHHFRSKADLATQLVDRYIDADVANLHAGLDAVAAIDDPVAKVVAFLRYYEDGADELMAEQSGCLYATVLAERELVGTEITAQVATVTRAWRQGFADLLGPAMAAAPADGAAAAVDRDALADHLYATFEGGFILARSVADPGAMRAQLRVVRQLVEHLLAG